MQTGDVSRRIRLLSLVLVTAFVLAGLSVAAHSEGVLGEPSDLTCELMLHPQLTEICDPRPEFGWVVGSSIQGDIQTAYQVLVSSSQEGPARDEGDLWDSGKTASACSTNVEYGGRTPSSNETYFWRVRIWNRSDQASPYSARQSFHTGSLKDTYETSRYPLVTTEVGPVRLIQKAEGHYFVDFGKAAFGTVELTVASTTAGRQVEVHLGEVPAGASPERQPGPAHDPWDHPRRFFVRTGPILSPERRPACEHESDGLPALPGRRQAGCVDGRPSHPGDSHRRIRRPRRYRLW